MSITIPERVLPVMGCTSAARVAGGKGLLIDATLSQWRETNNPLLYLLLGKPKMGDGKDQYDMWIVNEYHGGSGRLSNDDPV